jgi:hypothetical protein
MGHEQTSSHVRVMSVIQADIHQRVVHVRLVPEAEVVLLHA